MQLHIQIYPFKFIEITVSPSDDIEDIRGIICERERSSFRGFSLFFEDTKLPLEVSIQEMLKPQSTLMFGPRSLSFFHVYLMKFNQPIYINQETKIIDLKTFIAEKEQVSVSRIEIIHKGKVLTDFFEVTCGSNFNYIIKEYDERRLHELENKTASLLMELTHMKNIKSSANISAQCTFLISGKNYISGQQWFKCRTCRMHTDLIMCRPCALLCHRGHDIFEVTCSLGYCDCGAGDLPVKCRCCVPSTEASSRPPLSPSQLSDVVIPKTAPAESTKKQFGLSKMHEESKGIFHNLVMKTEGKIENLVKVTSSSFTKFKPEAVLFWKKSGQWFSENAPMSWIQFDFVDRWVLLSAYDLVSHNGPSFLKSWVLSGSNDQNRWIELDSKSDVVFTANQAQHFFCQTQGRFSSFRFTMTGPSSFNDHVFCLRGVEFHGIITKSN